MADTKKIAVLGAGFGGLRAARQMAGNMPEGWELILIDKNEHQTFNPLLYEVAATSEETAGTAKLHELTTNPIKEVLGNLPVKFVRDEIKDIDLQTGKIFLLSGKVFKAEYILLALGSEDNYFQIPGAKNYAKSIKSFWNAIAIRNSIYELLRRQDQIRVVVCGGGATGVELASELKMWCGELNSEFRSCRFEVCIVEASPSILGNLNPGMAALARKRLHFLGVRLFENQSITEVTETKIFLNSGKKLEYDLFVWAGGVKPNSLVSKLPLKKDSRGRLTVNKYLQCETESVEDFSYPNIYAIGDIASFMNPKTKKPVPGIARAAINEGAVAARNIINDILNENRKKKLKLLEFKPKNWPSVIAVGGKFAVVQMGSFVFQGFLAWFFKGLIELRYLLSILPFPRAISTWFKGLLTFIQNDRLG